MLLVPQASGTTPVEQVTAVTDATPTIAAIIPVYNRPKSVFDAINSVLAQSRLPEQLIIVDDGSTDATPQLLRRWRAEVDAPLEVTLIHQPNGGASLARNAAAKAAGQRDVLAFLDSDDLWPADYVARVATAFAVSHDVVISASNLLETRMDRTPIILHDHAYIAEDSATRILLRGPMGLSDIAVRASAFHKVGGFDPSLIVGEDYMFLLRVTLLGRWAYLPGDPVLLRKGSGTAGDEATHLSDALVDRRRNYARLVDRFIHELGGSEAIPASVWRPHVGKLWYKAGRRMSELRRYDEARQCFRRAVEIHPWQPKAWFFGLAARLGKSR